ncbi:MAG: acetyl-CoA carboxylase biotin carboxyl carrier protein subunit [Spirochaetaceae bacterium]|nr:MAG: acetyl-CoA carboxylase biotin carboxyl carrier protein subunit [Spirochaetaceae bacterium]
MKKRIRMKYEGQEFSVTAERSGDTIVIERDGRTYSVQIVPDESVPKRTRAAGAGPAGSAAARSASGAGTAASAPAAAVTAGSGTVVAPMTGTIKEVMVAVGDSVSEGDTVMMMEAMKMDMEIAAHSAGTVKQIMCASGDSVKENQALLTVE